jgi:uncharacterized protein
MTISASRVDRIAPIWRFLLAVVVIFGVLTLAGAIVGTTFMMAGFKPHLEVTVFLEAIVFIVFILLTFKLMLAVLDQRTLGSMGLAFHPRWWIELGQGLALGAVMIMLVALAEWGAGYALFGLSHRATLPSTFFGLCLFAAAAVREEVIFRGYAFQRLTEAITPLGAIIVTSVLFSLVHMANPHHTWVSTANTAIVGVAFSLAYLRTRALWLPIGLHLIWNFILGAILGLPVSGLVITSSVLVAHVSGPERLTGGAYGPEGGLVATVVMVIATVYLAFSKRIHASEEMKALVATPLPSTERDEAISIFTAPSGK